MRDASLPFTLREAFVGRADREALRFDSASWTLGELLGRARRYASGLGLEPGDSVAVFAETSPDVVVALLGHLLAGMTHVPVNPGYREDEARHVLVDSGAKAVLVAPGSSAEKVLDALGLPIRRLDLTRLPEGAEAPDADVDDDATALLAYTSGTTGKSKGVELSRRALEANLGAVTRLWRFTREDRVVVALPLFHVHGLCLGVIGALLSGAAVLLHRRFDAERVVAAFENGGATVFMGVPTMYVKLLALLGGSPVAAAGNAAPSVAAAGNAAPSVAAALAKGRLFTAGSAPLSAQDHVAFEARTGHRILERYGMSETLFTLSNPYDGERRAGSVGLPVPGVSIRIVDDAGADVPDGELGELWVRGPGVMTRYRNRPDETAAAFHDGWFRTGDLVRRAPDGYVTIAGRKSVDILKSGGFKISAREIEDVLLSHPAVSDAAVVGLPDRVYGESVVAAVVLSGAVDETELLAFCAERLAAYKRPRQVRAFETLPRNAMGKAQKHLIVKALGDAPGAGGGEGLFPLPIPIRIPTPVRPTPNVASDAPLASREFGSGFGSGNGGVEPAENQPAGRGRSATWTP